MEDTEGDSRNIDVHAVLDAIAIQQGIFVERTTNIYSFSHLTLQEYLTAKYISQKDSRIQKLVTESLTDKRWHEVFLLVAGIKDEVDPLLELMAEATHNLMNTPKLKNILQWVERITDSTDGDFQYLGKRALANANVYSYAYSYAYVENIANTIVETDANADDIAIVIAIAIANANAIAFANANADAIADADADTYAVAKVDANGIANAIALAFAIAFVFTNANAKQSIVYFYIYINWSQKWQIYRDIDYSSLINQLETLKQEIPNDQASESEKKDFTNKLLNSWFDAFHTTPEAMQLSREEIKTLDNYLYANLLIIECKNAAVRVSQKTWQKIESEMLLPRR